jgi:hypothetical protein
MYVDYLVPAYADATVQLQNGLRAAVELANAAAKDSAQMARPSGAARSVFDAIAHIAIAMANRSVAESSGFLGYIMKGVFDDERFLEAAYQQTVRFCALYEQAVRVAAARKSPTHAHARMLLPHLCL